MVMGRSDAARAVTVALIDDYDVVVIGLAHMFDHYGDRVVVAEIDTNEPLARHGRCGPVRHVRPT